MDQSHLPSRKLNFFLCRHAALSVSLGPVITFVTSPVMNVILKGAVASTVIFLSASTTSALHWFVSPYVHKLRWKPGSDSFEAQMLSWLATPIPKTIKFADIRPPETKRPFVTFKADDNFYSIDVEHFNNKALLARLIPRRTCSKLVDLEETTGISTRGNNFLATGEYDQDGDSIVQAADGTGRICDSTDENTVR